MLPLVGSPTGPTPLGDPMTSTLRRAFAAGALTALAMAGSALPSQAAETSAPSCDDTVALSTAVTAAQATAKTAKAAFLASNRPLAQQVASARKDARAEARQSQKALKSLAKQARRADTGKERRTVAAKTHTERRELAHAHAVLTSKKAAL